MNWTMLELIVSLALYVGAVVLLLKGAFTLCDTHDTVATEP